MTNKYYKNKLKHNLQESRVPSRFETNQKTKELGLLCIRSNVNWDKQDFYLKKFLFGSKE